jgi:hypothetical protein
MWFHEADIAGHRQQDRKRPMKLPLALLVVTCFSAAVCPAAWTQDAVSRTFTGTNGPGTGSATFTTDDFVVTAYGSQNEFAIVVASPGGDICGREFYFTGTVSFQPNQNKGSIGGPMQRCTNPDLVIFCDHKPIYDVAYTGTIERNDNHSHYLIKITWPDEKWLVEDCQKKREDVSTETILLSLLPPAPPPRTPGDAVRDANDAADQVIIDAALLKGLRHGTLK